MIPVFYLFGIVGYLMPSYFLKKKQLNLLIIEDEPGLSKSILTYLVQNKFICDTASDFRSADHKIIDGQYDCIILDITLTGREWP